MFKVGTWVGAGRWPNRAAHPDHWGQPFGGRVLAADDTVAWSHSFEFPTSVPSSAEVMNLVIRLRKEGKLDGRVPILWDFKTHRVVQWESEQRLRTFQEDMILWRAAKEMRRDEIDHPRRKTPRLLADFLPEDRRHLAHA